MQALEVSTQPSTTYTIANGDTLELVANQYAVTVGELANANPQLLLKEGEVLNIPVIVVIPPESVSDMEPADEGDSSPTTTYETYTVQPGDTLSSIAAEHGTTVEDIALLNNITNPNAISVGQVLKIP